MIQRFKQTGTMRCHPWKFIKKQDNFLFFCNKFFYGFCKGIKSIKPVFAFFYFCSFIKYITNFFNKTTKLRFDITVLYSRAIEKNTAFFLKELSNQISFANSPSSVNSQKFRAI